MKGVLGAPDSKENAVLDRTQVSTKIVDPLAHGAHVSYISDEREVEHAVLIHICRAPL